VNAEMMMIIFFFFAVLDAIFLYSQFLLHRRQLSPVLMPFFFLSFSFTVSYVSLEKHLASEAEREKSLILLSCHLDFTIEKNKNEDSRVIGMKRRNFTTTKEKEERNFRTKLLRH
jgi:hypothetical protein